MGYYEIMRWDVRLTRTARKQATKLPEAVRARLLRLLADIEITGPVRGDWPNYGKLAEGRHHCHLKKGRPSYVAVWEEHEGTARLVEVIYAGTYEKAPY